MPGWILLIQIVERSILLLLLALSIWSVSIMIDRRRALKNIEGRTILPKLKDYIERKEWGELRDWVQGQSGLIAETIRVAIKSPDDGRAELAVRSFLSEKKQNLEKGINVLATLGSNAPFIGLFGTVLGIVQAFAILGLQGGSANDVMSSISLALVATAAGLFVAIPAVVAFNVFSQRVRLALAECEAIRDFFLAHRPESTESGDS